jgi:membrane protein DedA with SNARE-associated domain
MENLFIELLKEYGYIVLFLWSILEGEIGLVMGGLLCHTGHMWLPMAIFVAGIGGFIGDQIYFYMGRFNKNYIHRKLRSQRRKFAISHLLLKKYGWYIIFIQRYLYGLRTVIPMSIGLTKYSSRKFAIINLISAWMWAALTIIPSYYYGEEILNLLHWIKKHWYFTLPAIGVICAGFFYYLSFVEKRILEKRHERKENNRLLRNTMVSLIHWRR